VSARPLRVLQVGWGFHPWRVGGLILYAEDLMAALAERGHGVTYFFAGRHYPFRTHARLRRWHRDGVDMRELVNPPIVAGLERGTRRPDLDLAEPWIEEQFAGALREVEPDVVHVQELHGLPSSLLDVAAEARVPVVMTLHDYGPLCSTLRLFDADGRVCTRTRIGADCVARNAGAPLDDRLLRRETVEFELRGIRGWFEQRGRSLNESLVEWLFRRARVSDEDIEAMDATLPRPEPGLAGGFQQRRDVNVERLGRVDRLIAQSPRIAEIYRSLGVSGERMSVVPAFAGHIERLRPRRFESTPTMPTFVTLGGCASQTKGSRLVAEALEALRAAGAEGRFRLRVLGHVDPAVAELLEGFRRVEPDGLYGREQLDAILEDADVGLMPSVWEEALGYTGLEMLAKGIPVIANPLGGIAEYVRDGETGWVNVSCTGRGLAEIMLGLIDDPEQIVSTHRSTVAAWPAMAIPWTAHVDAVEGVYRELA
jgi:glycosyltransferase involved in cell wall biosynthesis